MLSTLTTFALLASAAFSTPISNPTLSLRQDEPTIPSNWTWHISNWEAGCTRTCYYNFNITVPTTTDIAGVKAYCSGYESGSLYTSCRILEGVNNGVSAKFGLREEGAGSPKEIFLSFEKGGYLERYVFANVKQSTTNWKEG
jgi:hypothetical protein